ncbi:MAG: aspartate/glutamate racemase family protein [Desulfobacteraceae bacterium]|nr:aspartate/glutamate racemase family protein [Desulfobacteraceae bacterium]
MKQTREKIVGIIGGMGPEATVDLMQRIIRLTPAADDMDHIRCIVDNNPKVPSRIKAIIEGDGEDPGLWSFKGAGGPGGYCGVHGTERPGRGPAP